MFGNDMIVDGKVNQGAFAEAVKVIINASPAGMNVGASGGQGYSFNVEANVAWGIINTNSWIVLGMTNGVDGGLVQLNVMSNVGINARTGIVQIAYSEVAGVKTDFVIIQAGYVPIEWCVDIAQVGNPADGTSWETAFTCIQDAIDAAAAGDIINVRPGIYMPIVTGNKVISIESTDGAHVTIIDGGGTNRCATFGTASSQSHTNTMLTGFTLHNGYISNNYGGGVYGGTLNSCILSDNRAVSGRGGGAVYSILNNCVLFRNSATGGGGGAYDTTLYNCTVASNTASQSGGGVFDSTLYNSIVWNNTGSSTSNSHNSTYYYSCVAPFPANGSNNIMANPLFIDAGNLNFHLQSNSPCVNMGNTNYVRVKYDVDGNLMIVRGNVSMGAYAGVVMPFTSQDIPYTWFDGYELADPLTARPVDYETASEGDFDGDGFLNWEEYIAGTNPTNATSLFHITSFEMEGSQMASIAWVPNWVNRNYTVIGATNICDDWSSSINQSTRFFGVKVEFPLENR